MAIFYAYKNRGITKDITMQDGDGDTVVPASSDKIRAIIGRQGNLDNAELTVTSGSDTANGSSFTKNSPSSGVNRLRLDASDLDFAAGIYTIFFDLYDSADANEWKNVSRETFVLEETD